jgi:P27 family predicted phage terminase small subunit
MPTTGRATAANIRLKKMEIEQAQQVARSVEPLNEAPPLPEHLGTAGREVWSVFWAERLKTISAAEVHIVQRYAEMIDRRDELVKALKNLGWSVQGSRPGMLVRRAEVDVLMALETELRQMERVLGLGPQPRARLQIDVLQVEEGVAKINGHRPMSDYVKTGASRA